MISSALDLKHILPKLNILGQKQIIQPVPVVSDCLGHFVPIYSTQVPNEQSRAWWTIWYPHNREYSWVSEALRWKGSLLVHRQEHGRRRCSVTWCCVLCPYRTAQCLVLCHVSCQCCVCLFCPPGPVMCLLLSANGLPSSVQEWRCHQSNKHLI